MREIKFRAWSKMAKRMENVISLGFQVGFPNIIAAGNPKDKTWMCECCIRGEKFTDLELMQYTGLKDKNGKEIYEGDIVKTPHKLLKDYKWEVLFQKGAFVLGDRVGGGFRRFDSEKWTKSYEIIGNIYENPELLK